jgi:hypothetical protein
LRQVLAQVDSAERAVARGLELIGQAAGTFAQVTQGSTAGEPNEVAAQLAVAQRALTETQWTLAGVTSRIIRYLAVLGFAAASPVPPSSGPATLAAPSSARIDALRAQLPPRVVPGSGQKTHGRWIGPDGTDRPIVSGRDADSAAAWELLKERGLSARTEPVAVSHAEQKLAARMVRDKIAHATLVINNRPCRGPSSCDTLLPVMLPAGYSLTVHGPNYRKTFSGGANPPWR